MQNRLPDPIYQLMPFIHISCGLCACFYLRSVLAVISGMLLILAGILTLILRYRNRNGTGKDTKNIILLQSQEKDSNDLLLKMRWRKSYESGNAVIDEQHRMLHELGGELVGKAIKQIDKDSLLEIRMMFDNMVKHLTEHFTAEEALICKIKHPNYETHKERHRSLLSKCEVIAGKFSSGHLPTREILDFIVTDLIADHLRKDDVIFFGWLK